jgi:hypothetical protein
MAEFQWWLLIVGVVAGGALVAVVTMDGRRREEDVAELERRAETTWIANRLIGLDPEIDARTIEAVLRLHREYLGLPPPDRLVVVDGDGEGASDLASDGWVAVAPELDGDPDRATDDVRDDGGRGADEDLATARVEHAPAGEQAHAGADGEERAHR